MSEFFPDINNLKVLVKQFEESKRLINKSKAEYARMAIILLDNIIEILSFNYLRGVYKNDDGIAKIKKPRFSRGQKNKFERFFNEKIKFLKKLGIIDSKDFIILKIIHSYRNSIYHRDIHNPFTVNEFSRLYFVTALKLFKKIYNVGVYIGGIKPKQNWLKKYGLCDDSIDFSLVSKEISVHLLKGIDISLIVIKRSIFEDIIFRLNRIKIKREKELPWLKNNIIFNHYLRVVEYFDKNPYSELSKIRNKTIYKFLEKNRVNRKEAKKIWEKAESEKCKRDKKIKNDLVNFKQTIDTSIIKNSEKFLIKNNSCKNIEKLLGDYYRIDEVLTILEFYLDEISEEFDREVQREIDISRGK